MKPDDNRQNCRLTVREQCVLECASQGQSDKQIAGTLGLSLHTVDTHWRHIRRKLGVSNRAAAIAAWLFRT